MVPLSLTSLPGRVSDNVLPALSIALPDSYRDVARLLPTGELHSVALSKAGGFVPSRWRLLTKHPRGSKVIKRRIHNKGFEGGRYAPTEEELYKKALELLDKCKIETRR